MSNESLLAFKQNSAEILKNGNFYATSNGNVFRKETCTKDRDQRKLSYAAAQVK